MKVFVTGASGFVGRQVVRRLGQSGHQVRILARHPCSAAVRAVQKLASIEVHEGDVTRPDTLRDALAGGVEAVVHLVGIISEVGRSTFERVHLQGTQALLAATQAAGVRRFLHMSALGTRRQAISRYHQTKWAAEEAVRCSGQDYTIFRPSLIFGPGDHFVNLFARISRYSPVLPVVGDGRARFMPVSVQSVSTAFCGALTVAATVGQTLDLCGPDILTFDEMLDQILAVLDRRRLKWHLPLWLASGQARVLEAVFSRVFSLAPPLNRDQILMLQEDNVGDGRPALELLGLPQVRFQEGIAAYLAKPAPEPKFANGR